MAMTPEVIDAVVALVQETGLNESVVARLRAAWPGVHITCCHDDDVVGPPPVREHERFRLYLVDGRYHCLRLTADPDAATGLVLVEVEAGNPD